MEGAGQRDDYTFGQKWTQVNSLEEKAVRET